MVQIGSRARHASDRGVLIESGFLLLFFSSELHRRVGPRGTDVSECACGGRECVHDSSDIRLFVFLSCSPGREGWGGKL